MPFITATVLIILVFAAVTDLLYRKIPNLLKMLAMLFGIVSHSCLSGLEGFLFGTGGMVVPGASTCLLLVRHDGGRGRQAHGGCWQLSGINRRFFSLRGGGEKKITPLWL